MNMELYIIISVLSGVGGAVAGFIIFAAANRLLIHFKMSRRVEYAQMSQEEAEKLLKKKGFRIIAKQPRRDIVTYVDGKPNLSFVQADFMVENNKKKYVAEVKAGELVSDPNEPSTRRQLLEYKYAYRPDGLLLVDMMDSSIHSVEFEQPSYSDERIFRLILGILVAIILACVLWIFVSIKIL